MMDATTGVRKAMDTSLDTSLEENAAKVQKVEEEVPKWARDLITEIRELKEEVKSSVVRCEGLVEKVDELELKQEESNLRVATVEERMDALEAENADLRGELKSMRVDLNDQIDRGLRDHLHIVGLPELTREKTWDDTIKRLTNWLHEKLGKSREYYDDAIWRAHRGPYDPARPGPRPIFAQMKYRVAEEIKNELKFKNIGGVPAKDQFCKDTQERQNKALVARKEWKRTHEGGMAYVSFPATLKTKMSNDSGYKVEQIF